MAYLSHIATSVSLELFVVAGAFLEEIIAPIPSPFVMSSAAVIAREQHYTLWQIFFVIVIAAAAKTVSTYVVYVIADKAEDVLIGKYGKYVGLSHSLVEKIGSFLTGTAWDDFLLFLARALPFIPTILVSAGAGVIKYNVRSYIIMTFLGTIVRNAFYVAVGYYGWTYFERMWMGVRSSPVFVVLLVIGAGLLAYAALKTKDVLFDRLMDMKKKDAKASPASPSSSTKKKKS